MTSKLTMARRQSICVAVLAAGQSRRFGDADKLAQPLGGKPLGLHICDTIQPLGLAHSLVITSAADHPCVPGWRDRGFEIAVNHAATEGLGGSVALAAKLAAQWQCDALLVCLADMPFVPADHLAHLIEAFGQTNNSAAIATHNGHAATPPAIFGRQDFAGLANLGGDTGARALLSRAKTLPLASALLLDIDTAEELEQARHQT